MPPPEQDAATCPLCGYDLRSQTGQPEPRCPECGRRFDWADFADPARRRHPYLFEHHPERPIWSYFRTLVGGLRPRRFWASINPAGPSNPRRFVAYWLIAATLWTAVALVGPMAAAVAEQVLENSWRGKYYTPAWWGNLPPEHRRGLAPKTGSREEFLQRWYRIESTPHVVLEVVWSNGLSPFSPFRTVNDSDLRRLSHFMALLWLLVLTWPCLSVAVMLGLRATRRQAQIGRAAMMRTAAYAGDVLLYTSFAYAAALGSSIYLEYIYSKNSLNSPFFRTGLAAWLPDAWEVIDHLPAALALCWLLFAYRLYAAHRRYLRLPHALGVVLATQAVLLLILANLYVLTLI